MPKIFILLFCLLFILPSRILAQRKFIPGYVITLQNDTLPGKVLEAGIGANSRSVRFMDAADGQEKNYGPEDIKGYGLESGRHYLVQDLTSSFVGEKLFSLRVLNGYVNLYETMPQAGNLIYVLQKNDGSLVPLEKKTYFGLLKYHLNNCPTLTFNQTDFRKTSYSEAGIRNLLSRYNQCLAPQVRQTHMKRKLKINYGVLLGAATNHYRYIFGNELYSAKGDYGWSSSPAVGVFWGISLHRKIDLEMQALYGQASGTHIKHYTNGIYGDETFRFAFRYLNVPLVGRFYFWDRVYVSPGFNLNFRLSESGSQTFMSRTYDFNGFPGPINFGGAIGAGVKIRLLNRVSLLEARMSSSRIMDGVNQMATFNSYQILLRTSFNK